jgi:hypothetical protein
VPCFWAGARIGHKQVLTAPVAPRVVPSPLAKLMTWLARWTAFGSNSRCRQATGLGLARRLGHGIHCAACSTRVRFGSGLDWRVRSLDQIRLNSVAGLAGHERRITSQARVVHRRPRLTSGPAQRSSWTWSIPHPVQDHPDPLLALALAQHSGRTPLIRSLVPDVRPVRRSPFTQVRVHRVSSQDTQVRCRLTSL